MHGDLQSHAQRLGWLDAEPAILHGRYRSTYEALRRSDHELAVAGRAFWARTNLSVQEMRLREQHTRHNGNPTGALDSRQLATEESTVSP